MVVDFIQNFCVKNKLNYEKDHKGNIYVTKGLADYYPCVVAHMDTVHKDQVSLVDSGTLLDIIEWPPGTFIHKESKPCFSYSLDGESPALLNKSFTILNAMNPETNEPTGIGGDDKCGVYICLELLSKIDNIKAVFFVEEECGMLGSKNLSNIKFFENVGYALQFDAPTKNWFSYSCSGVKLWSEEFFDVVSPALNEHSVDNISYDPFTDVVQLRKYFDFCCAVLPTGYYDQHSANEFVVKEHTLECVEIGKKFINLLGEKRYTFIDHSDNDKEQEKYIQEYDYENCDFEKYFGKEDDGFRDSLFEYFGEDGFEIKNVMDCFGEDYFDEEFTFEEYIPEEEFKKKD